MEQDLRVLLSECIVLLRQQISLYGFSRCITLTRSSQHFKPLFSVFITTYNNLEEYVLLQKSNRTQRELNFIEIHLIKVSRGFTSKLPFNSGINKYY